MTTLLAYHSDPAVKSKYLARVRAHRDADRLVKGIGWEDGKGCAVGCTLEAYDHERYPIELGIPTQVAELEDRTFEGLKNGDAQAWPTDFLEAIEPGADLALVWPRFAVWLMDQVEPLAEPAGAAAIRTVRGLHEETIAGRPPSAAARAAAWAAAWDAFWISARNELLRLLRTAPCNAVTESSPQ